MYPTDAGSLQKKPVIQPKNYTMTRTIDNSYHFTKDSSATGPDAPQVDDRQTEEQIKGTQVESNLSLLAPPPNTGEDKSTDTKKKPRRKTSPPTTDVRPLTAAVRLNKNDRMLYKPSQFNQYDNFAILDTEAIQSALSEYQLSRIIAAHSSAPLHELPAPNYRIRIANDNILPTRKQVLLVFPGQGEVSKKKSWYYPRWTIYSLECLFLKKYSITLDLKNNSPFPEFVTRTSTRTREVRISRVWARNHSESSYSSVPASDGTNDSCHRTRDINMHHRSYTTIFSKIWPHRDTITQPTIIWLHDNPSHEP